MNIIKDILESLWKVNNPHAVRVAFFVLLGLIAWLVVPRWFDQEERVAQQEYEREQRLYQKRLQELEENFNRRVMAEDYTDDLGNRIKAQRTLLLRLHNGDSSIYPLEKWKLSVVSEGVQRNGERIRREWQDAPIPEAIATLFNRALNHRNYALRSEYVPDVEKCDYLDEEARKILAGNGTQSILIYHICTNIYSDTAEILFLSISYEYPHPADSVTKMTKLSLFREARNTVSDLRDILQKKNL